MSIELKVNKKMNLQIPEFTCDGSLAPHLDEYEMLKCLNGFRFTGLIGKPGSGKTSLMMSLLTGKKEKRVFRKVFNHVILVMPTHSRNSLKKNIFEKHNPEKMFDDLNLNSISQIYDQLTKASDEKETTLLILDDVGASLKNFSILNTLQKIIYNRRHLKVSIFVLLQNFTSIPLSVRKLFNNVIMFKPAKKEFETLFDELFEQHKDKTLDIMKFAFQKPHDYLFLNVDNQRMFKDFDEIILDDEN